MKKWLFLVLLIFGCGEEYYSTPEKTLGRFIQNKTMGSMVEVNATLSCFTKEDQEWWSAHYQDLCEAKFGKFSRACEDRLAAQTTVWADSFEHAGPESTNVTSSNIDEDKGTAILVVDGNNVHFAKENGNWKIDGFFGMRTKMEETYPQIK